MKKVYAILFYIGLIALAFTIVSWCVIFSAEDENIMALQIAAFPKWVMLLTPFFFLVFREDARKEISRIACKLF